MERKQTNKKVRAIYDYRNLNGSLSGTLQFSITFEGMGVGFLIGRRVGVRVVSSAPRYVGIGVGPAAGLDVGGEGTLVGFLVIGFEITLGDNGDGAGVVALGSVGTKLGLTNGGVVGNLVKAGAGLNVGRREGDKLGLPVGAVEIVGDAEGIEEMLGCALIVGEELGEAEG